MSDDKKLQEANEKLDEALAKVQEEVGMRLVLTLDYRPTGIVPQIKWIEPPKEEAEEEQIIEKP